MARAEGITSDCLGPHVLQMQILAFVVIVFVIVTMHSFFLEIDRYIGLLIFFPIFKHFTVIGFVKKKYRFGIFLFFFFFFFFFIHT